LIEILSSAVTVPANSSRFFETSETALNQPTGVLQLGWNTEDPYLFNKAFNDELILHDDSYCTSVVDLDRVAQLPTLDYFSRVANHLTESSTIVDIGCGQGEFVDALRVQGWQALGFDPALRRHESHLFPRYWQGDDIRADLYVMRCVLPHIAHPWDFIASIAASSPRALVLVEFQQFQWLADHGIWYGLFHDHVNMFDAEDFSARYDVIESGEFADREWGWVLIDPTSLREPEPTRFPRQQRLTELFCNRGLFLQEASRSRRPIAIWGAAGKGTVLSHALKASGAIDVHVIDADPHRWGKFLESSGLQVLSPDDALKRLPSDSVVLVCNPNHLSDVVDFVDGRLVCAETTDFCR
jgi:hypothetical protein